MSTTHSPPPTAAQPSHPVGFNKQTYYDPFFPSSPCEEQLVPIDSDRSPSHYSYQAISPPPHTSTADNGSPRHSQTPPPNHNHLQPHPQTLPSNSFHSSHSPHSEIESESLNTAPVYLSPSAYVSDNGYSGSSEHTTTPGFSSGFYLEDDFGLLQDPIQYVESNDLPLSQHSGVPQDNAEIGSPHNSSPTRTSLGAATLSSHLMSPVLTNSDTPGSRQLTASPPGMEGGYASHELFPGAIPPRNSINGMQQRNVTEVQPISAVQQTTPTLTESSKGTSPDLSAAVPHVMRAPSPVVRIESYTRGDSPARGATLLGRSGSKRSRAGSASSHLSVRNDQDHYDEDDGLHGRGGSFGGRSGLDPESRFQVSNTDVPNFKDQEENAHIAMKNADVAEWLAGSEPGSEDANDAVPRKPSATNKRQRAASTGAQSLSHANLESFEASVADAHLPGPGVLINEESGDDEEEEDENEAASIDDSPPPSTALGERINDTPGEARPGVYDELSNQPPLHRAKLWQDPLYDSSDPGVKMQPETANAAIKRLEERAGDIETLSRVATWGTRRLSESDLEGLFREITFNEKLSEKIREKRERSSSFLQQAAARLVPRRANLLKREESDPSHQQVARPSMLEHSRNDSSGSRNDSLGVPQPPKGLQRMTSLGKRPKSPRINTGSAVAAMALQAGALGAGGSVSATATSSPTQWPTTKNQLKRPKSRTDMNSLGLQKHSSSSTDLGLAGLWNRQGGPPLPSLAAPVKNEESYTSFQDAEDDDDEEVADDAGVTMDLSIRSDIIDPTLDGFKSNIRQLNPRLPPFMFDRIAQEQLRRFKKLMDFKLKHAQALSKGKCQSGKHCTELGGLPTYLPSKSSSREPEVTRTGLSVAGLGQSDDDVNALAEGVVTPAQFPPGVPMPPVKRLPAEFECSLCFKVKKFHKPSDWSKHVHEDVQPFTCTFATCAEPKSFKRKADWVRHENERHRQLEWWMCNMNDCSHRCYRKDNFVQHLVREHKLPEPKVKTTRNGKPAVRGPSSQKARVKHGVEEDDEIDQVWKLVEECRHETPKNPKDEACKFCGNVCNSWKKLTVHLAKHMEQISMPVLGIVSQKEVTAETIISPIEQRIVSQQNSISPTAQSPLMHTSSSSIAPFGMPVGSVSEMPIGFTAMIPPNNYFAGATEPQTTKYQQRVSPSTYPPPKHAQYLAAKYAQQHRGSASGSPFPMPQSHAPLSHSQTPMSDYSSSFGASPTSQFNPVNASSRGFTNPQQAQRPTRSPENIHGGLQPPTSQPCAMPYDNGRGFQYVSQKQQTFSPIEGNAYRFGNATSSSYPQQKTPHPPYQQQTTPPSSYSQQQQQDMDSPAPSYSTHINSIGGGLPMTYDGMGHMQGYPQGSQNPSLYNQPGQEQQHGYAYGQH